MAPGRHPTPWAPVPEVPFGRLTWLAVPFPRERPAPGLRAAKAHPGRAPNPGGPQQVPLEAASGGSTAEPVLALGGGCRGQAPRIMDGYAICRAGGSAAWTRHCWASWWVDRPRWPPSSADRKLNRLCEWQLIQSLWRCVAARRGRIRILTAPPLPPGPSGGVCPRSLVEAVGRSAAAGKQRRRGSDLKGELGRQPLGSARDEGARAGEELLPGGHRLGPADLGPGFSSCGVAQLGVCALGPGGR